MVQVKLPEIEKTYWTLNLSLVHRQFQSEWGVTVFVNWILDEVDSNDITDEKSSPWDIPLSQTKPNLSSNWSSSRVLSTGLTQARCTRYRKFDYATKCEWRFYIALMNNWALLYLELGEGPFFFYGLVSISSRFRDSTRSPMFVEFLSAFLSKTAMNSNLFPEHNLNFSWQARWELYCTGTLLWNPVRAPCYGSSAHMKKMYWSTWASPFLLRIAF